MEEIEKSKPTARDVLPANVLKRSSARARPLPSLTGSKGGVAIYCRRSTDDENDSIARQVERCRDYVENDLKAKVAFTYEDAGVSGEVRDRPELNRLFEDAEAGRIKIVAVEDVDRLGRSLAIVTDIHDKLLKLGVIIHTVRKRGPVENIDIAFGALQAAEHMTFLRTRAEAGRKRAVEEGDVPTLPPFGYIKDYRQVGKISIDPEKAPLVKWMFEARASGMSLSGIARAVNEKLGERTFRLSGVGQFLRNPLYKGVFFYYRTAAGARRPGRRRKQALQRHPDEWITVPHPELQIVDEDLWDAVVSGLEITKTRSGTRLLSGKCVCAECGNPFHVHRTAQENIYYCCTQSELNQPLGAGPPPPVCEGPSIEATSLEKLALDAVRQVLTSDQIEIEFQRLVDEEFEKRVATMGPRREELEKRRDKLADQLLKAMDLAASGNFPRELVEARTRAMTNEFEKVADALKALPNLSKRFVIDSARRSTLLETFDRVSEFPVSAYRARSPEREEAIAIIRNLVAGVEIKRMPGSRTFRCKITIAADAVLGVSYMPGERPEFHKAFEYTVHRKSNKVSRASLVAAFQNGHYSLSDEEYALVEQELGHKVALFAKIGVHGTSPRRLLDHLCFLASTTTTRLIFKKVGDTPKRDINKINAMLRSGLWDQVVELLERKFPTRRDTFNPGFRAVWLVGRIP